MGEEVTQSSLHATEADLRAIAIYLKDQQGGAKRPADPLNPNRADMQAGAAIYSDVCSACHTPTGSGVAGLFPALAGSSAVQSVDPTTAILVILGGAGTVATPQAPTAPAMPSFAHVLDDAQVAAIATYIRNAWGNEAEPVSASTVTTERARLGAGG
jgi:mono/diheme cytochrome c family protein